MAHNKTVKSAASLLLFVVQLATQVYAGTQFASHVSVNTPARSFTHGVGDPLPVLRSRNYNRQSSFHRLSNPTQNRGYPRVKPSIPFTNEDKGSRDNTLNVSPWQKNNYMVIVWSADRNQRGAPTIAGPWASAQSAQWERGGLSILAHFQDDYNAMKLQQNAESVATNEVAITVLPPSPYKVDSPDPESLWPEGLLLPSFNPPRFVASNNRRSEVLSDDESLDPYLLEGSEAVAAVKRASGHGLFYFHDIPHIASLLANQELRVKNNLKPHRIASIRHTWPYNRP